MTDVGASVAGHSIEAAEPQDLRLGQLRLIDLSVSIEHDAAGEMFKPRIEYVTHAAGGLKGMMDTFGAKPEDFVYSNGHGWAVENLVVGSHTATHIDAPYHYERCPRESRPVASTKCRSNGALGLVSCSICGTGSQGKSSRRRSSTKTGRDQIHATLVSSGCARGAVKDEDLTCLRRF
jgi:hypothetical protein